MLRSVSSHAFVDRYPVPAMDVSLRLTTRSYWTCLCCRIGRIPYLFPYRSIFLSPLHQCKGSRQLRWLCKTLDNLRSGRRASDQLTIVICAMVEHLTLRQAREYELKFNGYNKRTSDIQRFLRKTVDLKRTMKAVFETKSRQQAQQADIGLT